MDFHAALRENAGPLPASHLFDGVPTLPLMVGENWTEFRRCPSWMELFGTACQTRPDVVA